jgi:hypothetical protein
VTDSSESTSTTARSSRLRFGGRVAAFGAAAALAATGAVAAFPGIANAAPPSIRVVAATCTAGHWHIHWALNNNHAEIMTITSENVTGAVNQGLAFTPSPVPDNTVTNAFETIPAATTGTLTAHVTYHYPLSLNVGATADWAVGDSQGGAVTIVNNCTPTVSLAVAPTSVTPGSNVNVSGQCQANTSGVAYTSAFVDSPPTFDFAGLGAVPFTTDATGHFTVPATVATTTAPGTYQVSARCGGGNIGVTADLTVVAPTPNPTITPATPTVTFVDPPVKAVPAFTG